MDDISQALSLALQFHQSGNLAEAGRLYREILVRQPFQPDALHLLGVVALQQARPAEAVDLIARAIDVAPGNAAYLTNLGAAYSALQQWDRAAESLRRAIVADPNSADAHFNLGCANAAMRRWDQAAEDFHRAVTIAPARADGHNNLANALRNLGRSEAAESCYREALRLRPELADAHNNLGTLLQAAGRLDEAAACFSQALAINPQFALAHNNLGVTLQAAGRHEEAMDCFERAIRVVPQMAAAHYNLANSLKDLGRLEAAEHSYREAIRLEPKLADAHNNLGLMLQATGRFEEALACYEQAVRLDPQMADAHNNRGVILQVLGRFDEALVSHDEAIRLRPDYADAHYNRAFVFLTSGDFAPGWASHRWRVKRKEYRGQKFSEPLWDGSHLAGRTLLVHTEQGLGDTMQFIRYIALVRQLGGTVFVQVPANLMPLLTTSGYENLVAAGTNLPEFDVQAPLLSLPGILGTTLGTIPNEVPYLAADPRLVEHWRRRLEAFEGFKIGIAWQGNPNYQFDRIRSIPLSAFGPLAQLPGVRLFSLQKGLGAEQIDAAMEHVPLVDLAAELDGPGAAFMDTAAVMKNLDLVVTSDSAPAHLAGALGVPTWLAVSSYPEWRWMIDRADSPWYPTMRLFRQQSPGDWEEVFRRMAASIRLAAGNRLS